MVYDYVIVGAGSAGCVLAARLSEDPDVTVCLIEAGPSDDVEAVRVPTMSAKLLRTRYDWDYDSHDEPALSGRRVFLPRGRVLGGTSSINAMIYARGNRLDYDGWDVPGWSYDEVLPYFRRSEDNERGESEFHGIGGPLAVSDTRSANPSAAAFIDAAVEAGYAVNKDFNGAEQDGFGFFQLTQRDGLRESAASAFLSPVRDRPNLTVTTNLQVHRVLIERGRVIGVTGHRLNEQVDIRAAREVIVCSGAYNSPQLLMLSGIGPADALRAHDLPVVADIAGVGQNLRDHPLIPLTYTHSRPEASLLTAGEPESVALFETARRGPLTSNGPEAGGFVRTRDGLDAPNAEIFAAPVMFPDAGLEAPSAHAIACGSALLTPQSRGSVELVSDDPTAKPRIRHNYLREEADLADAVAVLRMAVDISRQRALRPYAETLFRPFASESDADLRAYIRRYVHSIFHPTSTCALGDVVDPELRVFGVDGLRVADASVMPDVGRGHPNAAAIMIGEKAADLIRDNAVTGDPMRRDDRTSRGDGGTDHAE